MIMGTRRGGTAGFARRTPPFFFLTTAIPRERLKNFPQFKKTAGNFYVQPMH